MKPCKPLSEPKFISHKYVNHAKHPKPQPQLYYQIPTIQSTQAHKPYPKQIFVIKVEPDYHCNHTQIRHFPKPWQPPTITKLKYIKKIALPTTQKPILVQPIPKAPSPSAFPRPICC